MIRTTTIKPVEIDIPFGLKSSIELKTLVKPSKSLKKIKLTLKKPSIKKVVKEKRVPRVNRDIMLRLDNSNRRKDDDPVIFMKKVKKSLKKAAIKKVMPVKKVILHLLRSKFQQYPFHIVLPSPWPLIVSLSLLALIMSLALTMHGYIGNITFVYLGIIVLFYSILLWFRDIISEATYIGDHTIAVRKGINLGFLIFVGTEILIFVSLFWSYFHSAMNPDILLGGTWPPIGILAIQPLELPLLNLIILLSSGALVTYSHHALIEGDRKNALNGLFITLWLVIIFVLCQYIEYTNATFTISDGVYGTVFYAGTGLHFMHMIMLAVMLSINYWRIRNYHLTSSHHLGYETLIIYCHVLDVIWLFLYIVFYWWGV